jgi:hypothetical protein
LFYTNQRINIFVVFDEIDCLFSNDTLVLSVYRIAPISLVVLNSQGYYRQITLNFKIDKKKERNFV